MKLFGVKATKYYWFSYCETLTSTDWSDVGSNKLKARLGKIDWCYGGEEEGKEGERERRREGKRDGRREGRFVCFFMWGIFV